MHNVKEYTISLFSAKSVTHEVCHIEESCVSSDVQVCRTTL